MTYLQDWNQAIDKALQLFFIAEDFTKVAQPDTIQFKNYDTNEGANFPIHLQAEKPIAQSGLDLSIIGDVRFAQRPNKSHFSCKIPISITNPKWLLNEIHQHCKNGIFEIPNNSIQGTITVDFLEDDHVYQAPMFGDISNFRLDSLLASALRQSEIPESSKLSDFAQWSTFIFDGYISSRNDMNDYLTCSAAAKLIVTNACNVGEPQFQKTFTLCALAGSLAPLKSQFPEAF